MNPLPSPPLPSSTHHRSHLPDPPADALISAAWHSIQQAPPPSLREILDAYRTKGDGDRDMLIAMLNAKSAEDQRMASLASLQKSMLDMYHSPQATRTLSSLHIPEGSHAHTLPHSHYDHSRQLRSPYPSSHQYHAPAPHIPSPPPSYHHHPSRSPAPFSHDERRRPSTISELDPLLTSPGSRKRRRSRSPPSREHLHYRSQDRDLPLPPSPYSSSSQSSGGSPRSRDSMAIGALLSARGEEGARRTTSSAREHS